MDQGQTSEQTTITPPKEPVKVSARKQNFYAVVKFNDPESSLEEILDVVEAPSRTDLKKQLLTRSGHFEVVAIFKGRQVKFEARTQVNIC